MKLNFLAKPSNKQSFSTNKAADPICLMRVEKEKAQFLQTYKDQTYYFCSKNCQEQFNQDPEKYLS